MISILDLPAPEYIWEGDGYWGILYYSYPECLKAIQYCKDNSEFVIDWSLSEFEVLDTMRGMVIAGDLCIEGLEGDIIIMHLRSMDDVMSIFTEGSAAIRPSVLVVNGIENVKRASFDSLIG